MTDIKSTWSGRAADYAINAGVLAADRDLDTALVISLFTDRRAEPDDELPFGTTSRRGWWGDTLALARGEDNIGSRLWLLSRAKQTQDTLNRAVEFAREALAWLVEDGVAEHIEVDAEWIGMGILGIQVGVWRPSGERLVRKFDFAWEQL